MQAPTLNTKDRRRRPPLRATFVVRPELASLGVILRLDLAQVLLRLSFDWPSSMSGPLPAGRGVHRRDCDRCQVDNRKMPMGFVLSLFVEKHSGWVRFRLWPIWRLQDRRNYLKKLLQEVATGLVGGAELPVSHGVLMNRRVEALFDGLRPGGLWPLVKLVPTGGQRAPKAEASGTTAGGGSSWKAIGVRLSFSLCAQP